MEDNLTKTNTNETNEITANVMSFDDGNVMENQTDEQYLNQKSRVEAKKERIQEEKKKLKAMKQEKKSRGMSRVKAEYSEKFITKSNKKIRKKVANQKGDYISADKKQEIERKKLGRGKRKKIEELSSQKANDSASVVTVSLISKREVDSSKTPAKKLFNIVSYGFVCVLAMILGFLSGNIYVQNAFSNDYNYVEAEWRYSQAELENIIASNSNIATTNALYAILIAEENLKNCDYYECVTPAGSSYTAPDIAPKQNIYSYRKKDGMYNEYLTVTEGIMSVAERSITSDYENFDIYRTKNLQNGQAVFGTNPSFKMTYDEMRKEYGTDLTNPIAYVISNKTIHPSYNGNPMNTGFGVRNLDGTYTFTLKLNTDQSVMNYVRQMKHMSELANYPIFSSITLTFTLTENFEFVQLTSIENYTVYYFGVPARCHGELYQDFSY